MSVLFQTVINAGRLCSYRNLKKSTTSCRCLLNRKLTDAPRKFVNFEEVVAARRAEARRSIVVQVNSEASFSELHAYCSKYADIKGIHHYKNSGEEHFMLIEFNTEENLKDVLQNCSTHQNDVDVMSLQSPFLWFRAAAGNKDKLQPCSGSLVTKDGCAPISEDALYEELMGAQTVSDQIHLLYERTKLNDLGVRLRYLVARELEIILDSLFANFEVRPFGSSVNGFGRMGCDLDLVLTNTTNDTIYSEKLKKKGFQTWKLYFDERSREKGIWYKTMNSEPPKIPWFWDGQLNRRLAVTSLRLRSGHMPLNVFGHLMRLVDSPNCSIRNVREDTYHALVECARIEDERKEFETKTELRLKDSESSRRLVYQQAGAGAGAGPRPLELVAEVLERAPGAGRVVRILHARVPILKFQQRLAQLDVDLCCTNTSGVHMSALLHLLGALDARARALALAVRRWAAAARLTAPAPGRWITNFPLTLLVLHFLAQARVLPSVGLLVQSAEKQDVRIAEGNVDCTFLRDANRLPPSCFGQNDASLETLLLQFFEFYAQFNFADHAVSLNENRAVRKPNAAPLYIVNPLEQSLNVSRNVSYEECERLKTEVRNAAWALEAGLGGAREGDWGLLGLLERGGPRGLRNLLRVGNSHRLISVKDLFTPDEQPISNDIKNKLDRLAKKGEDKAEKKDKIKFKNGQVASEVYRIRRDKIL